MCMRLCGLWFSLRRLMPRPVSSSTLSPRDVARAGIGVVDCVWRSEAIAEGALSVHVLSAGGALAHHDLIDEEVDEEVVSEPSERLELHLDLRLVHLLHLVRERGCHTDMHR